MASSGLGIQKLFHSICVAIEKLHKMSVARDLAISRIEIERHDQQMKWCKDTIYKTPHAA